MTDQERDRVFTALSITANRINSDVWTVTRHLWRLAHDGFSTSPEAELRRAVQQLRNWADAIEGALNETERRRRGDTLEAAE